MTDIGLLEEDVVAPGPIAVGVAPLDHESLHDPMERKPIVLATGDVLDELGDSPGGLVSIKFKLDRSHACLQHDVLVAERLWSLSLLHEGEHQHERQDDCRSQYDDYCSDARRNGLVPRILLLQLLRSTEFQWSLLLAAAHLRFFS